MRAAPDAATTACPPAAGRRIVTASHGALPTNMTSNPSPDSFGSLARRKYGNAAEARAAGTLKSISGSATASQYRTWRIAVRPGRPIATWPFVSILLQFNEG
jgi:hypothetical protein